MRRLIVELRSGVGNQLFQYATGRAVSLRLGVPLVLDTGYVDDRGLRPFSLNHFNIAAELLPDTSRRYLFGYPIFSRLRIIRAALQGKYLAFEKVGFEPRIFTSRPGTLFLGYWQCEDYFRSVEPQLRQDLNFRAPPPQESELWLKRIANTLSVSVHVRRGDYVPAPGQGSVFANCSPDYYWRAAMLIAERTESELEFFLFSDDPKWALENIKLPGKTHVIDHNGTLTAHEDMRMMAACKHNIIANSTFSWWGGWLNPNPSKIVVAPKTWYLPADMPNDLINSRSFTVIENTLPDFPHMEGPS